MKADESDSYFNIYEIPEKAYRLADAMITESNKGNSDE